MKKLLFSLILSFLLLSTLATADISFTEARSSKGTAYEDEEVIFSVDVISGNATTRVFIELIKTNSTSNSTLYYDLALTGSSTRGTWIKFFKEKEGIYEITKITAIDNTSYNKTTNLRDYGFFGFQILKQTPTPTTTSSPTTPTTTASSQTSTTSSTTTTTRPAEKKTFLQTIFDNPIILIMIIVAVIAIPILIFLFMPS